LFNTIYLNSYKLVKEACGAMRGYVTDMETGAGSSAGST